MLKIAAFDVCIKSSISATDRLTVGKFHMYNANRWPLMT